jgi:hypothetical protein
MKEELRKPAAAVAMAASVKRRLVAPYGRRPSPKKTAKKCEKWIFGIFRLELFARQNLATKTGRRNFSDFSKNFRGVGCHEIPSRFVLNRANSS